MRPASGAVSMFTYFGKRSDSSDCRISVRAMVVPSLLPISKPKCLTSEVHSIKNQNNLISLSTKGIAASYLHWAQAKLEKEPRHFGANALDSSHWTHRRPSKTHSTVRCDALVELLLRGRLWNWAQVTVLHHSTASLGLWTAKSPLPRQKLCASCALRWAPVNHKQPSIDSIGKKVKPQTSLTSFASRIILGYVWLYFIYVWVSQRVENAQKCLNALVPCFFCTAHSSGAALQGTSARTKSNRWPRKSFGEKSWTEWTRRRSDPSQFEQRLLKSFRGGQKLCVISSYVCISNSVLWNRNRDPADHLEHQWFSGHRIVDGVHSLLSIGDGGLHPSRI